MKVLFLAHRIPFPPNKGDKIRSFHELCALVERGHEVHLAAFADDLNDLNHQVELARLCASVHIVPLRSWIAKGRALLAMAGSGSLSRAYYRSAKMKRIVRRLLDLHGFDAVQVFSSTMAQYVPEELRSRTVVDLVDIDSQKWRDYARHTRGPLGWLYGVEGRRLRQYEYEIVSRHAWSVLTSPREAALLDELDEFTRRARLRVITNGVDLERYQPAEPFTHRGAVASQARLIFVGAMDYYANIEGVRWFVEQVFPLIRAEEPYAEFFIVGSNPTEEVKRLGRREGVTVTGYVEDVRPYLRSATASVMPLRIARGVQNKMLESMALGKAIIATGQVAAGLKVVADEHLMVADAPADFAAAVIEVLRDKTLRDHLGSRARRYVETEHDWQPLLDRMTGLIETAGARSKAALLSSARASFKK
ncbi:MAG: TIGR03087 family PEP-CTERM/XrtA system glycosyltransferase [Blastocatellia bacterium]|nr:TIGR03087 family PEP-CTERM/XrtA system glycosyltransferase [Blastocatellia bacterium]